MRRLLGFSTAALVGFAAPAAFASIIPTLSSTGLVMGQSQYTYAVDLSSDQEIDVNSPKGAFANSLTLSGGALGPTTGLVSEDSFLTGFAFSTGANSISLTCPAASTTCGADQEGPATATLVLSSPATGQILGTFQGQAAKNSSDSGNELLTSTGGSVAVPAFARVPEPASLAIFGTALAGLGLLRRRRKNV